MTSYEEEFCKGVINDEYTKDEYHEIATEMLNKNGDVIDFIKSNLTSEISSYNTSHLDKLAWMGDEDDVEDFATIIGMDMDYISDIEEKKSIWEDSENASEIQEKLDELIEERDNEDEDW